MNKPMLAGGVDASVVASADVVAADIRDRRSDSTRLFQDLSETQREQLAVDAWTIGLRALSNAYAQAQEARLQDVGAALIADVDRQLQAHITKQQETIATVLGRFFDPKDGQVMQRLSAFVDDQGVLARLLQRYLSPDNGVLAQTLARQVGETSPLFKKLSPTESNGLVQVLENQLRRVMADEHTEMVRALDPLAEDGAVARFLKSLRRELESSDEDRAKQLQSALAALNANDENSLLSQLVRESNRARQVLLNAVNPEAPDSPMAIMKTTLTALLKEHASTQSALLTQQTERQQKFETEIRDALARLETKRTIDQTTPRGGLDFEDAVVAFVAAAVQGAPCVVEASGNAPGAISRCKKGDLVVRFTAESAFSGTAVVFEAKRDSSYTTQKALEELDVARKNRDASAGVFIMAKSHAPDTFPRFARFGNNVLAVWDEQDPSSAPYLHAAVLLGLGLVTRSKTVGDAGDIAAIHDLESRIEDELNRLGKMEKHNESIKKSADNISEEIRKAHKALDLMLRNAKSTLRAMNIELTEEAAERASPIRLPSGLPDAVEAVLQLPRKTGTDE
jgi:hypothetical protein